MKIRLLTLSIISCMMLHTKDAVCRNYYLSETGNNNDEGTLTHPWKTLNKISNTALNPGDTVFFKRGDRFDGHFVIDGSGTKGSPIVITAYGEGNQPIISGEVGEAGGGDYQEAILVQNEDNLVFDDLEIRNDRVATRSGVKDTDAYGIYIDNTVGVMENFLFQNMTIKNVFAVQPMLDRSDFDAIQVSGIRFRSPKNTSNGNIRQIRNIEIKDSYFTNLQRLGIQFKAGLGNEGIGNDSVNRIQNIHIHHNEFYYNGGSGILPNGTYNCLMEYNVFDHPGASTDPRMPGRGSSIWNIWCINTVMQYNHCIGIRGYLDSHGIHIDNYNKNTFVQYNYMEDCEGGFVEILRGNKNAVYRFNVSVNDGFRIKTGNFESNHTIWINAVRHKPEDFALGDSIFIYNNTAIIDKPFVDQTYTSVTMDASNAFVYNNIFTSTNGGATVGGHVSVQRAAGTSYTITNNLFLGNIGSEFKELDQTHFEGSPDFVETGEFQDRYRIKNGSTVIDKGASIQGPKLQGAGYGVFKDLKAYPDEDLFGNPFSMMSGAPNIGADNAFNGTALSIKDKKMGWNVFPLPSSGTLNIVKPSDINGEIQISLTDLKGQIVLNQKHDFSNTSLVELAWSDTVPNGIYVLNLSQANWSESRKVVLY